MIVTTTVISLGGSIIAPQNAAASSESGSKNPKSPDIQNSPNSPDTQTIAAFVDLFRAFLAENPEERLVVVVGGGAPARSYQAALRKLRPQASNAEQDWLGILATRLNAELLRAACGELCPQPVIHNPETQNLEEQNPEEQDPNTLSGKITLAAGWKPGFSTDYVAVVLAEKFRAQRIINVSNIDYIYSADPRSAGSHSRTLAFPIVELTWTAYSEMVGTEWIPGKNLPFDPIAAQKAAADERYVHFVGGSDLENVANVLRSAAFRGTLITPTAIAPTATTALSS